MRRDVLNGLLWEGSPSYHCSGRTDSTHRSHSSVPLFIVLRCRECTMGTMPPTALSQRFMSLKENLSSNPRSSSSERVDAVVAVLLYQDSADELNTLLIHRMERSNDPWSGQIGLPGGRVEKFDGTTQEALEREVREE